MNQKGLIIVLIDISKKNSPGFLRYYLFDKWFSHDSSDSFYAGHYILATAMDDSYVYYLNPSRDGVEKLTLDQFEVCRKARGTD